jgi:hypothetical protein
MDKRFRPISIEMCVAVIIFLVVAQLLPQDLTNPFTLVFFLLALAEFIRILYKLRKLRKEGVDISAQQYRSPLYDAMSPKMGNTYSFFNKKRIFLLGLILLAVIILTLLRVPLHLPS